MDEGLTADKKSALCFSGDPEKWHWKELAKDCVALANARGGTLYFGIEDHAQEPPPGQRISESTANRLQRGIASHCVNVGTVPKIVRYPN